MPYSWIDPRDFEPKTRLYADDLDEIVNDLYYLREQIVALWPVGVAMQYPIAGALPPSFLECDGTVYANTAWPALAAKLGQTWGGVAGASFGVPDYRGRSPIGAGQGTGLTNRSLGSLLGVETVTLTLAQTPSHSHAHTHPFGTGGQSQSHWHGLGGHYHGDEHDHAINHWHLANIGQVRWLNDTNHVHYGFGGTVAEGPWHNVATAVAVNVDGTAQGAPNGNNISGYKRQGGNTGGPSGGSDGADRDHTHSGTTGAASAHAQGSGSAHENMQPSAVTRYIIRAA